MKPKDKKEKKPKFKLPQTPFAWVYFFFSVLLVAGGALFVLFPQASADWTSRILGGLTVLFFLYLFVLLCAREKKRNLSFFFRLFAYFLAVFAGGYLMFSPDTALTYLSIAVGVYALMDAGFKLRLAISGCHYRVLLWWALTVTAGLAAVGGLVLLRFLPEMKADVPSTAVIMGITMLCTGLQNFIAAFEKTAVEQARAKKEAEDRTTVVVIDAAAARKAEPEAPAAEQTETDAEQPRPVVPKKDPDDMTPYELYCYLDEIIDSLPVTRPIPGEVSTEEATVEEPAEPSTAEGDTPGAPTASAEEA